MKANSTHEDLVNKYISDYFTDKPNTTGLNKKQGALLIVAIRRFNQDQKIDPAIRRRIKTRLFTINDKDELLLRSNVNFVYNIYISNNLEWDHHINTAIGKANKKLLKYTFNFSKKFHNCFV
jgi:hypothetical protein